MDVKKQLLAFARMFLPTVGFVLMCIGAYMVSLQSEYDYDWKLVPVYAVIVFGFLAMLIGVFWSLCHSMKSKMNLRRRREQNMQVFTVERRPSSFPPSYEESQSQSRVCNPPEEVVSVDGVDVVMSLAPPLYNRDSSEVPDCRWSWEHPPPYSQVVLNSSPN